MKFMFHYRVHKSPKLVIIMGNMYPVHTPSRHEFHDRLQHSRLKTFNIVPHTGQRSSFQFSDRFLPHLVAPIICMLYAAS
jgi:hypothetical protein